MTEHVGVCSYSQSSALQCRRENDMHESRGTIVERLPLISEAFSCCCESPSKEMHANAIKKKKLNHISHPSHDRKK